MPTIELVAINATNNNIKARQLDTDEKMVWRGRNYPPLVVEGEIFEVEPEKEWVFNKAHFISGKIVSNRIDIAALGLEPLSVNCIDRRRRECHALKMITTEGVGFTAYRPPQPLEAYFQFSLTYNYSYAIIKLIKGVAACVVAVSPERC